MLELLEHESPDTAPVVVRMGGELLYEQGPHPALLEVPHVDPAVVAAGVRGALGVADDLVAHLEEQLVDVLLAVRLDEPALGEGPLILDRLAVHVTEAELQELPGAVEVAAMDATDAHLERRLGGIGSGLRHERKATNDIPLPSARKLPRAVDQGGHDRGRQLAQ